MGKLTFCAALVFSLGLPLTMPGARAQAVPGKPVVPGQPSPLVPQADTALVHLVPQRTPGGVRYVVRERGTGPLATEGRRVSIRYVGFLPDGHLFDATAAASGPLKFRVGQGEVIAGWDELLPLLPAGSRVRAWIPAALAYGSSGVRDPDNQSRYLIPPNTQLVFELHVLNVR